MSRITLKEKAYQELRRKILLGDLGPGDHLTEQSMVGMLEMSRTPIRAAIEKLESEGLVHYIPNKGVTIVEISLKRAIDIFDYRAILEPHIVSDLAKNGLTSEQAKWFDENMKQQELCMEARDYDQFTVLDSEFHLYLATCYANQEISHTMERLQDQLFQLALRVLKKDISRIVGSYQDHQSIVNFIRQGEQEAARSRMNDHIDYGKRMLVQ